MNAHRLSSVIADVLFLAVTVPAGNYLLSPLWERTTLVEANPLGSVTDSDSSGNSGDSSEMASPTPGAGQPELTFGRRGLAMESSAVRTTSTRLRDRR